ncbi:MAG: nodulation protein NfeD [archaeon]|nr:nodulation protein NfeD [archaeon]
MSKKSLLITQIMALWIISLSTGLSITQEQTDNRVLWIKIDGTITQATSDFVDIAINHANEEAYSVIFLTLNTPGGILDSTLDIIDKMQSSNVPIIAYVYPSGGNAWSAGTYILMASDYAAMAPYTVIGSAQPVSGLTPITDEKIINALVAKMRSFAELHGRNETQAVRFITHNDNLDPDRALSFHIIEAITSSPSELLEMADGKKVNTLHGEKVLNTKGAELVEFTPGPRTILLQILSDPTMSTLLITLGIFAILLGLSSPGWGAEVLGGVMLILGLIGTGFNVNYGALLLLIIGVGLMLIEVYTHAHGVAGIGGAIIMSIGIILLVSTPPSPLLVSSEWFTTFLFTVLGVIAVVAIFFGLIAYKAIMIRRKKPVLDKFPSGYGRTVDNIKPGELGYIIIDGEYWSATSNIPIDAGKEVKVVGKDDHKLIIEEVKN